MYEKLDTCPSCGKESFVTHKIIQDYSISGESFALVRCKNCSLIFTNPRPSIETLPNYYKSNNYISHTNRANSPINLVYKLVRSYSLKQKVKLIEQYSSGQSILDFGCGTGHFLKSCQKSGWKISGIEPDESARNVAQQITNINIDSQIDSFTEHSVDVITAWHVIEHVPQLLSTLRHLRKILVPGGVMLVAVPNHLSYDSSIYGEFWAGYDVPRHLYHFDKKSFSNLISKTKLSLIDILPMYFDSYYVSLLSESYKYQKSRYISAFVNGYKSNLNAKKTSEYSSLIFILKR